MELLFGGIAKLALTEAAISRKIGYSHMAFYRGWLQGLDVREMADAYLMVDMDLRVIMSTLRWIQDALRRAALRYGKHGEARLLRMRIAERRGQRSSAAAPSIDGFREEIDPADFYSYDEIVKQYLERYPQTNDRKARRRAALIERQIAVLNRLESLLATDPMPVDPVRAWFDPGLAGQLERAGVTHLSVLVERIVEQGYHWFRRVPRFGETRAKRVVRWVDHNMRTLGALPTYAFVPEHQLSASQKARSLVIIDPVESGDQNRASGDHLLLSGDRSASNGDQSFPIVPLETMLPPTVVRTEATPGRRKCHIEADNDKSAIVAWLDSKSGSLATRRAYRKEAERLLLWTLLERGKTFPALTVEDCTAYRDWLGALGRTPEQDWAFRIPQAQWFAPRNTKRYSPAWRPFEGALSAKSAQYALTVCASLFAWLAAVGYIEFDPWIAVGNPQTATGPAPDLELTHVLSEIQADTLLQVAGSIKHEDRRRDAALFVRLAITTGMRRSELAAARIENIYCKELRGGGTRWMLKVLGKGAKWRPVPLVDDVVALLREQLVAFGHSGDFSAAPPDAPLISREDALAPLTEEGVVARLESILGRAHDACIKSGKAEDAGVFARATAHWLRHTTGSLLGNAGVPPSQIQQLLGHASVATTTIYTQSGEDDVYRSVNRVLGAG